MSITIASTTGTAAEINEAAQMYDSELVQPAEPTAAEQRGDDNEQGHESQIAHSRNVSAYDSAKTAEEVQADTQQVQEDIDEDKAERRDQYVGKTRRKLLNRLSRLHSENERLTSELATYKGQQPPAQPQQNSDGQPAHVPQTEQQQQQFPPVNQQQANEAFVREFQAKQARLPELAEEAKARIPDLAQKLAKIDRENPVSQVMQLHVSTLDNPFDVGAYLSDHPQIIARMWSLEASGNGAKMIEELNRLSANIADGSVRMSTQPRQRVSAAPAPIRPVGGGASGSSSMGDPSKMPYSDYVKWRQKHGGGR